MGATEIVDVFAPVFQLNIVPPPAVNIVLCPLQILVLPLITAVGELLTITICEVVSEHPEPLVTITEYRFVVIGATVIAAIVAPVFQL